MGIWSGRRARAPGSRPCWPGRGSHPLFVGDSAALCAAIEEPRGVDPDALPEKDATGLSASTIARLKDAWVDEHLRWSKRDLTAKRYVYFWIDGIHVQARLG